MDDYVVKNKLFHIFSALLRTKISTQDKEVNLKNLFRLKQRKTNKMSARIEIIIITIGMEKKNI